MWFLGHAAFVLAFLSDKNLFHNTKSLVCRIPMHDQVLECGDRPVPIRIDRLTWLAMYRVCTPNLFVVSVARMI